MRWAVLVTAITAAFAFPAIPASAGYACGPGNFADRVTNVVDAKGDCFWPSVARIRAGDTVTFRNLDTHPHTVGGVAGIFGDGHKEMPQGARFTFRFDDQGVYPFFCVIHPGMIGAIVVGDGGTAAGTSAGTVSEVPAEPAVVSRAPASEVSGGVPIVPLAAVGLAGLILGGAFVLSRTRRVAASR
jgi:plastocyanin